MLARRRRGTGLAVRRAFDLVWDALALTGGLACDVRSVAGSLRGGLFGRHAVPVRLTVAGRLHGRRWTFESSAGKWVLWFAFWLKSEVGRTQEADDAEALRIDP
jgi:hypothetical protein